MWFQIFSYNLLIISGLWLLGFFPARFICRKAGTFQVLTQGFIALICGYFLFETGVAILFTKGSTVQWLNLLPFVILFFLPNHPPENKPKDTSLKFSFIPLALLVFTSWYFLQSYSHDLQTIDRYPFIDLVSYASTAFGMNISGAETVFFDSAIFSPDQVQFSLYHFTELWFTVGLVKLFGVTELYAVSFLVPVFFISLIGFGLTAIGSGPKIPAFAFAVLVFSLCFANGKLAMYEDIFFYNILDLCGLKISLIIPVLLFLYVLKDKTQPLIAFGLLLPQVNILLSVLLAVTVGLFFLTHLKQVKSILAFPNLVGSSFFGLFMVLMIVFNGSGISGPPVGETSAGTIFISAFNYFREAVFNLGINYWAPFIVVSALLISGKNILLLLPFTIAKAGTKALLFLLHFDSTYNAIPEVLLFFASLLILNARFHLYEQKVNWAFLILFILCCIGGICLAMTGFMDFEQIYTLFACSLFFILSFFLFQTSESSVGIIKYLSLEKYKWVIGAAILLLITYRTFRFQRVLPFDQPFYKSISDAVSRIPADKYSAYFSTKPYYPFPLHVQAGFPLMFEQSTAISTPVTMFEDSSWQHTERAPHVQNFPFATFARQDSVYQKDHNLSELQKRFIKHFNIRYLWFDLDYASEKQSVFEKALVRKFRSETDKLEYWIIAPDKL